MGSLQKGRVPITNLMGQQMYYLVIVDLWFDNLNKLATSDFSNRKVCPFATYISLALESETFSDQ